MKTIAALFVGFWTCISIYFGTGGFVNFEQEMLAEEAAPKWDTLPVRLGKIEYPSYHAAKDAKLEKLKDDIYPWIDYTPPFLAYFVTALSFGVLGAICSIFKDIAFKKVSISETSYITYPILGALTGILILGVSYVLPSLLVKDSTTVNPTALMFLCLFGALFADKFHEWLTVKFNGFFAPTKTDST